MHEPKEIRHQSSKEERDYVLEYQKVDISTREKLQLMGVNIDNITRDEAVAQIIQYVNEKKAFQHVLFLDPIKFMFMREGQPLHRITKKASMVLCDGGWMDWAAEQSGFALTERISIISLMMDLIRYSEKKEYTLFFLGAEEEIIEKLFFNLIRHFPEIRIVGRHSGHLNKARELMVKEAIRKTSPDIIFLAMDFPDQEIWIENNTGYFGKSVVIGTWGTFDTLSGMTRKPPDSFQLKGLHWLWKILIKPYRLDKVIKLIQFYTIFKYRGWKRLRDAKKNELPKHDPQ